MVPSTIRPVEHVTSNAFADNFYRHIYTKKKKKKYQPIRIDVILLEKKTVNMPSCYAPYVKYDRAKQI